MSEPSPARLLTQGIALYLGWRRPAARWSGLPTGRRHVRITWDIAIPMSDGVHLLANHHAPVGVNPGPAILIRSPYGRGREAGLLGRAFDLLAWTLATHGYHVVIQNTRGRFDSGGTFTPMLNEASDGLDTVRWIAAQPWFNGSLGMWGPSYLGYCTWAVATAAPPELKAVVPAIALSQGYTVAYMDGACSLDLALHALFLFDTLGNPQKWTPAQARRRWNRMEALLAPALYHLPLVEADTLAIGEPNPFYRASFEHPDPTDPYWQPFDLHARLGGVTAPALLIGGWYDLFLRDILQDYAALKEAGHTPYLTIGPWYHEQFSYIGEMMREALAWFDAHLRGRPEALRARPVRLYLMGAEEWREFDDWPPPADQVPYYLHTQGRLTPQRPADPSPPDTFRYDPADPTPNLAGPRLFPLAGPVDNRPLEARSDLLVYTSPPLQAPLEVIGPVHLRLYVRSSRAHTDFFARLCDLHPNGRSVNICDGLYRITPERGRRHTDGSIEVEVDMWATAHRFLPGHCLRLLVASGAHPRWNRNPGTGEPDGTATTLLPAEQQVYHDPDHPSALLLPVVP